MTISELIKNASFKGASDLHIVYGLPVRYRVDGQLVSDDETPLGNDDCLRLSKELAGEDFPILVEVGELDLARSYGETRVRVNLFRQQGHYSAAIRLLSDKIPQLRDLGLPPLTADLPTYNRGIVIVTGETGSGKSTTLAAILNEINNTRRAHIITLEDPIEYIYTPNKCIINQREIGSDTSSYASGLRASLREDPDVILIGEMRDAETIETAITAAETGHLVFSTLHTYSAADSVDRIVGVFPAERQGQIRMQLSQTLKTVLSQQLLPKASGKGRVCACELMTVNSAIKNLIREGKTPQISNAITTSGGEGGVTMDNALINLYKSKSITADTALAAARDPDYVKRGMR